MFSIEHEFDATVVTLVDEAAPHRQEDITVQAFEDCVVVEQLDPRTDKVMTVTFSMAQLRDLPGGVEPARRGLPAAPRKRLAYRNLTERLRRTRLFWGANALALAWHS